MGDDAYSASFENGTDVVADPRPSVSLTTSQSDGTLSGTVEATDEFGNLASAQLFVDDERIREWTSANGTTFETSFSVTLDEEQNSNRVRVTATDERGQSTAETNQAGEPELVRSGFVNGPVDSYHERIDSDRYTAVHETVIDLNGADPSDVSPRLVPTENHSDLRKLGITQSYNTDNDQLTISSKWAGQAPKAYGFSLMWENEKINYGIFEVTYSNPEPRIEVLDEGEDSDNRAHLLYIDVSESFDPDGQSLHFQAQDRDREPGNPDKIALEFSHTPGLVITDEQQNSVELSSKLYDYWSPRFKGVEEVTEGPYKPSETIKFEVESETFNIADRSYDPSLELSLKGATGDVTNWRRGSHESNVGHDPNPLEADHPQYAGTVEVDAHSYLSSGTPYIGIGNVKETTWKSLPLVNVFEEDELKRNNVSIENIEYTKREIDEVTVSSRTGRIRHEAKGYNVEDTSKGSVESL